MKYMSEHEEFKSWMRAFNMRHEKKEKDCYVTDFDRLKSDHEENQYLKLIKEIIEDGFIEKGRNGTIQSVFGRSMRFSLKNGKIPLLTTKKLAWKTCVKELLWFIRGETDNKLLQSQGVHIWDGNASKEFMKSVGLGHYTEGILGPIYGFQWRHFNAPYHVTTGNILDENKPGIDQLQFIIDQLKNPDTRNNRRLIMSAWNPCQLNKMALPPCHVFCQFNVHDGDKLSCAMYQRSVDVGVGSPFNIASYCFLTHLLAKHCGLIAHEFVYFMGNCHIYEEHFEPIKQQILRVPFDFPTLKIINKRETINDYVVDDFQIIDYRSHETIKMKMVV
jgi:thymidylate synthase